MDSNARHLRLGRHRGPSLLGRNGGQAAVAGNRDATLLVLTGQPIHEPIVSYGPFVMNTQEEIRQAVRDYQSGRMGRLAG